MNPLIELKKPIPFVLIALAFLHFGLLSKVQAVSPPPDGGYPNNNTAEGENALFTLTSGLDNTANGFRALSNNTTGNFNTADGSKALSHNTTGSFNTADGFQALSSNTTGFSNTANGASALFSNTTGVRNTADGTVALFSNTTGDSNTANGYAALRNNNTGDSNTATGSAALQNNTTGASNTANGLEALMSNTTGFGNTADGQVALFSNTTGVFNTATGYGALFFNTTGNTNTADGILALQNNTTGSGNVALGLAAGLHATTGSGNVYIGTGMQGVAGESNSTYIRNINTTTVSGGGTDTVTVNLTTGLLGHLSSSRRYKEDIKPMDKASEALFRLKPVTYRYKKEIDQSQTVDYGLIAEDVAKIDPNLTVCNREGQIESVRYNAINAMLLNEFLKEHGKVEAQEATIAKLQKEVDALTAGLQKVSAQLEVGRPAPQVVENKD